MSTTSIGSMNSDDKLYNTFLMELKLAEGEFIVCIAMLQRCSTIRR